MSDPLSFFAVDDGSDDTDSSDDDCGNVDKSGTVEVDKVAKSGSKILPPPIDVLSGAKKLEFVTDESEKDVDWDKLTKKAPLVVSIKCSSKYMMASSNELRAVSINRSCGIESNRC